MTDIIELQEQKPGKRCCAGVVQPPSATEAIQHLSDDLQILGHPVRLQILALLAQHAGQVCVCDLEAALPVKQPTVSHHLKLLRAAGLIGSEKHGQWVYYFIHREALTELRERVSQWLTTLG